MPTYFSVNFELNKSETAIRDFCTALIDSGLAFKSGYWDFESDSFDDIITWNQNKLDNNFELGYTEHYSHDYKQMLFDFCDFSEVRVYVFNHKKSSTFDFHLIIPEKDFFEFIKKGNKYTVNRRIEKMDMIKSFAKKMWCAVELLAVQTAWECSDYPPRAKNISVNVKPQAEPFCIIKNSPVVEKLGLPFEEIGRCGVLIEDHDNWIYPTPL